VADTFNTLVVDYGARGHALGLWLRQSPQCDGLFFTGDNDGMAQAGTILSISDPTDIDAIEKAVVDHNVDLVVGGTERALAAGLTDRLKKRLRPVPTFGPCQNAVFHTEASKGKAYKLMAEAGIPCPETWLFGSQAKALAFAEQHKGEPLVVKADGLGEHGNAVFICDSSEEVVAAIKACMEERRFGVAGDHIVIQRKEEGDGQGDEEMSAFFFVDGKNCSDGMGVRDYKRLRTGDTGPMTGGMGSYAPHRRWTPALGKWIADNIVRPLIQALVRRGIAYRGVLYVGIMFTKEGPKVLEFNCRFGDPEAQVLLPLILNDPYEIICACINGNLARTPIYYKRTMYYVGAVMASGGYPYAGEYKTGYEITGHDKLKASTRVLHAGTRRVGNKVETAGGRVLTVLGWGRTLPKAAQKVNERLAEVNFRNSTFRLDIGS